MLVQLFLTGMMVLSKVILNRGVFIFALLTYRQIVATIFLAPLSFFMERYCYRDTYYSKVHFFSYLLSENIVWFYCLSFLMVMVVLTCRGMHKKLTWRALMWMFFNGLFGYNFSRLKVYNVKVCDLWSRHKYQIWASSWPPDECFLEIISTEIGRVAHLMNGSGVVYD